MRMWGIASNRHCDAGELNDELADPCALGGRFSYQNDYFAARSTCAAGRASKEFRDQTRSGLR
jgi:hypothetical protein